ncbi:MAG: DUF5668 domain-containing protein [Acidobacteriota bacterium]
MKTHSLNRLLLGLLALGVGVTLLLGNLDLVNVSRVIHNWPAVLVAAGLMKLYRAPRSGAWGSAVVLTLIGAWLLLNHHGLLRFDWGLLWPLLLVVIGGILVVGAATGRRMFLSVVTDAGSEVDGFAIMGGLEKRCTSRSFRGGDLLAAMGGVDLDLRDSSIAGSEAQIDALAFWGGVEIRVPQDWEVVLSGVPIMGGVEDKTRRTGPARGRLVVRGVAIMGGVEVKN